MEIGGRRQATFVLRMWVEGPSPAPGGKVLWRGVIEHIQNGDHRAFQELDVALGFIEKRLKSETEPEARGM